jgi:hypothetical protein
LIEVVESASPTGATINEVKTCPFCAEEINAKAIKCKHCGSSLSMDASTSPAAPVKKKRGCLMNGLITSGVILACLFVLGVIGSMTGTKSDDSKQADSKNANSAPDIGATPKYLNEPFTLDDIEYTVIKMDMANHIGDSAMLGDKALKGSFFVIVTYTVENKKNETATIITDNIKLITRDGKTFSPDSKADMALLYASQDKDMILSQLQPGIKQTAKTAFAAPEASLKQGFAIEFPSSNLFSSDKQAVFPFPREKHKK